MEARFQELIDQLDLGQLVSVVAVYVGDDEIRKFLKEKLSDEDIVNLLENFDFIENGNIELKDDQYSKAS